MALPEWIREIRKAIESIATSYGIALVGYTPINVIPTYGEVSRLGEGMLHAVSMVKEIPPRAAYERSTVDAFYPSMLSARAAMDEAAEAISELLRDRGYRALPVTSAYAMDQGSIVGQISHKAVAHQAGLGWIGRNLLLVTPEFGPRVRLMTVITDADLDEGTNPLPNRCGTCRACIDGCPLNALRYSEFESHPQDRAEVFDFMRCHRQEKAWLERPVPRFCARCISNCPWGKRSLRAGSSPDGYDTS